jgi:SAM-dependent methyltransferase
MDGGEGSFRAHRSAMPTEKSHPSPPTIFPESRLAHQLLDGLEGLEIGAAAHNPFGLKTRNVGLAADRDPFDYEFFKQSQLEMCGSFATIDISADAASIPVPDDSADFVLHSHVWEHLPNPLIALDEWVRITRSGGYLFVIVPKRDAAASDKARPVTSLSSLVQLYEKKRRGETLPPEEHGKGRGHYTVFSPGLLRKIADWFNQSHYRARLDEAAFQETDDKVGNGHTIVWQVRKYSALAGFGHACFRQVKALLSGRRTSARRGS